MKIITWILVFLMFVIGITPRVDAGFSPSEFIVTSHSDRVVDLQKIQKFLEMKMVRQRLQQLGFTQDEVLKKLSNLSDQQIHYFAQNLDDLKVGSGGGEVLIVLLLIAIFVVLLLHLTGRKVIITK